MAYQLRCMRCSSWIGESHAPLEFVGVFKSPGDRELCEEPRSVWRCKACMWVNVFEPASNAANWRDIEIKT